MVILSPMVTLIINGHSYKLDESTFVGNFKENNIELLNQPKHLEDLIRSFNHDLILFLHF